MSDSSAYNMGFAAGAILGVVLVLGVIAMGLFSIIMSFVRRTKGWIIAAIIFCLLGAVGVVTGVVFAARGMGKAIAEASKAKAAVSDDGWVSVEIPGRWTTLTELPENATLRVGNKFKEEYLMLISERKIDFEGALEIYAEVTTSAMSKKLGANPEIGPIEDTMVGRFHAKRRRMAGKVSNLRIVYLHYSIESPEGFHQLIMWTLPSKERTAWPVFEKVAGSFAVVGSPKSDELEETPNAKPPTPRTGTVAERLRAILIDQLGKSAEELKPGARLKEDLGADELDLVELVMEAEDEFNIEINDADAEKLTTVGQLTEYVSAKAK